MPVQQRLHARCACVAHGSFLESRAHTHETVGSEGLSHAAGRPFAFATSPRQFERDRPFLVDHLAVDITLDVPKKSVHGSASLTVRRIDLDAETVAIDAIGFELAAVLVDGVDATYIYDGRVITVTIPKELTQAKVTVKYAATPRRGLYFLEPDEHVSDRPRQVWSQCQEEDARHWLPCLDKPHVKMTTEIAVKVPNGWFALSNGDLVSKDTPASGSWSFHYKMSEPHPSYLLTLVAGEFAELTASAGQTPLAYLVPKGREADGQRTFQRTPT